MKKILALILSALMLLSVASCGQPAPTTAEKEYILNLTFDNVSDPYEELPEGFSIPEDSKAAYNFVSGEDGYIQSATEKSSLKIVDDNLIALNGSFTVEAELSINGANSSAGEGAAGSYSIFTWSHKVSGSTKRNYGFRVNKNGELYLDSKADKPLMTLEFNKKYTFTSVHDANNGEIVTYIDGTRICSRPLEDVSKATTSQLGFGAQFNINLYSLKIHSYTAKSGNTSNDDAIKTGDTFEFEDTNSNSTLEGTEWDYTWFANTTNTSSTRVLYIGDSISRRTRENASGVFKNMVLDNIATSRALDNPYFDDMIKLFTAQEHKPSIILFNNGLHGFHLDDKTEYPKYYEEMIKFLLEEFEGTPIVLLLTTHVKKGDREARAIERNKAVVELAEKYNLPTVDLYSLTKANRDKYNSDGVHLSTAGYNLIAQAMVDKINELLG